MPGPELKGTEGRELIHKYKDAFSLRDEIGMYPNIEVEIAMTDKSPFFIRPFYTKEENKISWTKK